MRKSTVRFSFLFVVCLLIAGIFYATSGNAQNNNIVYLPVVVKPVGPVEISIDGIPLTIDSPFMPSQIVASNPGDASQVASAFSLTPYEEFSLLAVQYGNFAPIEDLPVATQGGSITYRSVLASFRSQQGGSPSPALSVELFGQNVSGSYSIVDLITGDVAASTLIVEWVVEAQNHIWIVRIVKDLSDGTNPNTFLNSLEGLSIVQNGSAQMVVNTSTDQVIESLGAVPFPSWWSGNCNVDNHPGSFQLATYDGLVSCGPIGSSQLVYFFPGAVGQYEWQCTELAKRYLYLKYSINPYQANGKDVVNNMPNQYIGATFERIANGTFQKTPQAGDVISFGPGTTFGHVAVVTGSNVDSNGNGTISIIEQNWNQNGQRSLAVVSWKVKSSLPVSNWLHEIEQTPPPAPTPTPTPPPANGNTVRVSISSNGDEGNSISYDTSISVNGRYIAFASNASNLVPGDSGSYQDIFVHDNQTGQTIRVSITSNGIEANGNSRQPMISSDGRYVVFVSEANNLDANYPGMSGIFIHDIQTETTSLVSVSSDGIPGDSVSNYPSISANNQFIAFDSGSQNLVPNDTNGRQDIFVRDLLTGETNIVSIASDGTYGNNESTFPLISADGRFIAFSSKSNNLVQNDANNNTDVFVHDRQNGTTVLISVSTNGTQGDENSTASSISSDGRYVVFSSKSGSLDSTCSFGISQIYVRDRETAETICVSVSSNGEQGDFHSRDGKITTNGQYIVFHSNASNLSPNDLNQYGDDLFIHNLVPGETELVLLTHDGTQQNSWISTFAISESANWISFDSDSDNIVPGDNNGLSDVFLHGREQ